MKEKILLVSLRFNPAFIQFLIAYSKAIRELGQEVEFLLDPAYRKFPELENAASIWGLGDSTTAALWTHAVFLNPSVENRQVATALKAKGSKILYVFHEPWQMSLGFLFNFLCGEGLLGTLKGAMAHHVSVPMLRLADIVILASQYGLNVYQKSDVRYNRNCLYLPLLYDDESAADMVDLIHQKRYFGYIGAVCRSHGFDQYLRFMRYALKHKLDIPFLVASRNPLPDCVIRDPLFRHNADHIEIRCGKPLGNEEMNRCYAESICVWNLYRRSTQSAVLPKAFMFGTPVIADGIGSFPEYIQDGVNGRFANARDNQGIRAAVEDMRNNIATYAPNCRRTFQDTFHYRSRLLDLRRMLN